MTKFYIIYDGNAIYGVGTSGQEVSEDAFRGLEDPGVAFCTAEVRESLYNHIIDNDAAVLPYEMADDGLLALSSEVAAETEAANEAAQAIEDYADELVGRQGATIPERAEMLRSMALTMLSGGPRSALVGLNGRGKLAWTESAPKRRDGRAKFAPLAENVSEAAAEMEANLNMPEWRQKLDAARKDAARAFYNDMRSLGVAIYGEQWVSPMAAALGIDVRTVQRWNADQDAAPWITQQLMVIARKAVSKGVVAELRHKASTIEAFATKRLVF